MTSEVRGHPGCHRETKQSMLKRNDVTPQRYVVPEGHGMPLKRSLLATMLTIASPADTDIEKMRLTGDLAQDRPVAHITNYAMIYPRRPDVAGIVARSSG